MYIEVHRDIPAKEIGYMTVNGDFECFTLEDPYRESKIQGETRIPAGFYEIKWRKELSGLTQKYRNQYSWFDWHLELQDVPNYDYVYIHVGNYQEDTEGCILVGDSYDADRPAVWNSRDTFKPFYEKVCNALGVERVFIRIFGD